MVLDLFDRISLGFFTAVILIPPMSTWSRVRHQGEGRPPLRSRAHHSGLPDLSPSSRDKVLEANNTLEIIAWAGYLALQVSKRKAFLFLMIPEDSGGHRVSGPASPWDLEDLRNLDRVNETVRGATFLCRFASADQKHPVGVLTNCPSLRGDLYLGWPQLFSTGDQSAHNGPLPRDCPCTRSHAPLKGTSVCIFNSATSQNFSSGFWTHILCAIGWIGVWS